MRVTVLALSLVLPAPVLGQEESEEFSQETDEAGRDANLAFGKSF